MTTTLHDRASQAIHFTWESLTLMVIVIVGAFLRFYRLGDIEFNIDQTYPIWQALKTLDQGVFPLAGQGIATLFPHPPLMGYIFLPFLVIGRDFIVVYMMTLTLNWVAIWFAYRGLERLIDTRAALIGAALLAANPWIIENSRQTSLQSLFPFFVCLIFWALVGALTQKAKHPQQQLLIALVGLAIFANTYLLAYALVVPIGILIVVFWKRIPRRPFFTGLGIFILLLAFYLIGLSKQWDDNRQTIDAFFAGDFKLSSAALGHAVRLVTGWQYATERGVNAPQQDAMRRADISDIVHWILTAVLVVGILKAVYYLISRQKIPQETRNTALILLIWFLLPILMMSYIPQAIYPFFLMLSVPAGHGLVAWAVDPLFQWRVGTWGIIGALVFTGSINGINSVRFGQETAAHSGEHIPDALPLSEARQVGRQLRDGYEDSMMVYTPMDEQTPMILAGEILPVIHSDGFDRMIVIPSEGGLYMTFHQQNESLNPPMHSQIVDLPVRFEDGTRAVVWEAQQNFKPRYQADIPSDIGVRFIGWWLLDPIQTGKTVELRTYWQVDTLSNPNWAFAPYAHVLDVNGNQIFVADGLQLPMATWRVGDWVVQTLSLSIPLESVGPFGVNVGLFDSNRTTNAIFNYLESGEQISTPDISIIPME